MVARGETPGTPIAKIPSRAPQGRARDHSIPKIFLIEFNFMVLQQPAELILERLSFVMLLLIGDVRLDRVASRMAHGERAIAGLPRELVRARKCVVHPMRRAGFQSANEVGERRLLAKRDQQVDVILDAADLNGNAAMTNNDSPKVFPEPRSDLGGDDWGPVFGAEDNVVMEAGVRLRHVSDSG